MGKVGEMEKALLGLRPSYVIYPFMYVKRKYFKSLIAIMIMTSLERVYVTLINEHMKKYNLRDVSHPLSRQCDQLNEHS